MLETSKAVIPWTQSVDQNDTPLKMYPHVIKKKGGAGGEEK